jgi:hypothetical protein
MKKSFLAIILFSLISCNRKDNAQEKSTIQKSIIENTNNMNLNPSLNSETLLSNINLDNCIFDKSNINLKKYKFKGVYIEDIKINDLLIKEYREDFYAHLEDCVSRGDDGSGEEFKSSLFTKLLMIRIQQLDDKNAYFLLKDSSKNDAISYSGIELYNQYLWELYLMKPVFFINEASNYNDVELLDYILNGIAEQYLINFSSNENEMFFCNREGLKSGMLLINIENVNKVEIFKKFKDFLKNDKIIEIDCAPCLENGWKSSTKEYYDIKPLIDNEIEKQLGIKEKIFYKTRIVPILKDYITK